MTREPEYETACHTVCGMKKTLATPLGAGAFMRYSTKGAIIRDEACKVEAKLAITTPRACREVGPGVGDSTTRHLDTPLAVNRRRRRQRAGDWHARYCRTAPSRRYFTRDIG